MSGNDAGPIGVPELERRDPIAPAMQDRLLNTAPLGNPSPPGDAVQTVTQLYRDRPQFWGIPGEQDAAFLLGEKGYHVVVGPGGSTGKSTAAHGPDFLCCRPIAGGDVMILIGDNKAIGVPENVTDCTALTDGVGPKLEALLAKARATPDFPERTRVLDKLQRTIDVIKAGGGRVPDGVVLAITNAGGYATGISDGLQQKFHQATKLTDANGKPLPLQFVNFTPPGELRARQDLVAALGGRNPRSGTRAAITRAAITRPIALNARALGAHNLEGTWEVVPQAIQNLIVGILSTSVDQTWKRRLDELSPQIVATLRTDSKLGALLIMNYWQADYSPADLSDNANAPHPVPIDFIGWEARYDTSPDAAWAAWARPGNLEANRIHQITPQRRKRLYFWFDRETTTEFLPPKLQ